MTLRLAAVALLATTALTAPALAQRTPLYQSGTITSRDVPKFSTNGLVEKAGGLTGDANGRGVNPFAITDNLGLGLCSNSAATSGQYNGFCIGHDSDGNGIISLDSYGGLASKNAYLRKNGVLYELPSGSGSGAAGPATTTAGNRVLWNSATGIALLDGGAPDTVNVMDQRFGAVCDGATDDSAAFTAAAASFAGKGGNIFVPATGAACNLGSGITLPNNVGIRGVGINYWTATNDTVAVTTSSGSWIKCSDTTNPCVTISGVGSSVKGVGFVYDQPEPAPGWTPTIYPYTIAVNGSANYTALENITITGASHCISLEGPESGVAGIFTRLHNIYFNGCWNVGTRFHRIDNTLHMSNLRYDAYWNLAHPYWSYVRSYFEANAIGWDLEYLANAQADGIEFFQHRSAIQARNGTVVSGFGTVIFAANELQISNISFNEVCQAVSMPNGNGTWFAAKMVNIILYGDSSTNCYAGLPALDLASDAANVSLSHVAVGFVDTIASIGHGAGGILKVHDLEVARYAAATAASPAFKVDAASSFTLTGSPYRSIRTASTDPAAKIIGPGASGGQGYEETVQVGAYGSAGVPGQGAVVLRGAENAINTGAVEYMLPSGARVGYMGRGSAAGDMNIVADNDTGAIALQVGASAGGGRTALVAGGLITTNPALFAFVQAGAGPGEGYTRMVGSGDTTNTGHLEFRLSSGARAGYVGRNATGVGLVGETGAAALFGPSGASLSVADSGGSTRVTFGTALPASCAGLTSGRDLWSDSGTVKVCP